MSAPPCTARASGGTGHAAAALVLVDGVPRGGGAARAAARERRAVHGAPSRRIHAARRPQERHGPRCPERAGGDPRTRRGLAGTACRRDRVRAGRRTRHRRRPSPAYQPDGTRSSVRPSGTGTRNTTRREGRTHAPRGRGRARMRRWRDARGGTQSGPLSRSHHTCHRTDACHLSNARVLLQGPSISCGQ